MTIKPCFAENAMIVSDDGARVTFHPVCPKCGRVVLKKSADNKMWIQEIMNSVTENEFEGMNKLMLNFLCAHTAVSPNGDHERVILICND